MGVGKAVALGRVLGVLEVIVHLMFCFGSLMDKLNEVGVGLEVGNLLDGMIDVSINLCLNIWLKLPVHTLTLIFCRLNLWKELLPLIYMM